MSEGPPIDRKKVQTDTDNRSTRRDLFKAGARIISCYAILATTNIAARAQQKASKDNVRYQDSPNGSSSCANCRFFDGENSCEIVAGEISADAWCVAFSES